MSSYNDEKLTDTITGLPKYNKSTTPIVYTWSEISLPEGYEMSSKKIVGTVTTITNKHVPEETEATVTKVWDDANNQDGIRPTSITMQLLADGSPVEGKTVNEVLIDKIATIGENMSIRRFARFESDGLVEKYIHGDGKIAVLVNMTNANKELAKDVCMQIAAAKPEFLNRESVPAERVEKEKEILKAQTMNEGKPEAIAEKIVMGRINKFFEEICLVDQAFVKDPSMKVSQVLKDATIVEFARFEKGEGIEKKEENFAEEVMSQLK